MFKFSVIVVIRVNTRGFLFGKHFRCSFSAILLTNLFHHYHIRLLFLLDFLFLKIDVVRLLFLAYVADFELIKIASLQVITLTR